MDYSELFEPTSFSLSNIRLKFFLSEMARKIKFLAPPLNKSDKVQEEWEKSCGEQSDISNKKGGQLFGKETLTEELLNRFTIIKPF
jgi:hypothetical protein